jgi:hypothetical protein
MMHDAMIMHKNKRTSNANRGTTQGHYMLQDGILSQGEV